MVFKTTKELYDYLQMKIADSLQNEVFEEVRDVEQKNIDSTVYKSHTPKAYQRRGEDGGLIADENIVKEMIDDNTLSVRNETPANLDSQYKRATDKNLPELIEYGDGYNGTHYDYPYGENRDKFMSARPFTQNTIEELEQTKAHVAALKKGLKRNGIDSK